VASIALQGAAAPSPRALKRLLERLTRDGYRAVITNALAPGASLALIDAGFTVRGRLHLLVHELDAVPEPVLRTRRARRSERLPALEIDAAAFDDFWRFDATALYEAMRATPRTHLRVAPAHTDITGYALFGRSGNAGYVQRLAVDPAAQGAGVGWSLLADGLRWLRSRGASRVFVNTQDDNRRAFDLYVRAGFSPLPVGLCVLGREL
jgi:ribosomal protein S18 acetylase RimI-like enzyme